MKEHRVGRLFAAGCFLLISISIGYNGLREYARISQNPPPDPVRVERGVFRGADIILEGEIKEQAVIQLASYSEFEGFVRKHNEHPIVIARMANSDNETVTVQYLLPSKRYYFIERIRHPWGWFYEFGRLAVDGESIVLYAHPEPRAFLPDIALVLLLLLVSVLVFPWRVFRLLRPATT